ncbi:MAG: hypothetical protein R3F56_20385 [Planctomycetota bacterium]
MLDHPVPHPTAARTCRLCRSRLCRTLTLAALALGVSAGPGAAQSPEDIAALARKRPPQQAALAARIAERAAGLSIPWFDSLRSRQRDAAANREPRADRLAVRAAKKTRGVPDAAALPTTARYVFGVGVVEPIPSLSKASKDALALAANRAAVESALAGILPGSDHALADLLRRLDTDTSADRFAAFLEAWRNGDESFYQALDRTAGTAESVFFYDAMLSDFVNQFVPKHGGEATSKVRGDLQTAHDALHDAFLAYRQYRAFREAVALSLVLPPDRPLPARLRRYEEPVAGAYSLREQVQMVLAVEEFDVAKVSDAIGRSAPALPQPLWSASYDPFPAWTAIFDAHMPRMIEAAGNTDAHLARTRARMQEWAQQVAEIAHAALLAPKARAER